MREALTENQTAAILQALDDTIEQGPWQESNFLRFIGKRLNTIRDDFAEKVKAAKDVAAEPLNKMQQQLMYFKDKQEVFIAIYSSQGNNMAAWERILTNLPKQVVSRPIYSKEKDARDAIRGAVNRNNEAYIGVYINPQHILAQRPGKELHDREGRDLLTLLDNSVKLDNMTRFVHVTGVYNFNGIHLTKVE